MKGYEATIVSTSKNISKKESVLVKDLTNAISLDQATSDGQHITIDLSFYAELAIHNEHARETDYKKYVLVDKAGVKYVTGSNAFWTTLQEIMDTMQDAADEEWALDVYKVPSKKYAGKGFLTCSVV